MVDVHVVGDIIAGVWILLILGFLSYAGYLATKSKADPGPPKIPTNPSTHSQVASTSEWIPRNQGLQPTVLASRSERDQVIARLKRAGAEERLTTEGMEGRIAMALRAYHRADLARLVADLPEDER